MISCDDVVKLLMPLMKDPFVVFNHDFKMFDYHHVELDEVHLLQEAVSTNYESEVVCQDGGCYQYHQTSLHNQTFHLFTKILLDENINHTLETLFNQLDDMVFLFKDFELFFRNDAVKSFFGSTRIQNQQDFLDTLSQDSQTRLQSFLESHQTGRIELTVKLSRLKLYEMSFSISNITISEDHYVMMIVRDISDLISKHKIESAEKEFFKYTLDSIGEAIIICNEFNQITRMNENATRIIGIDENRNDVKYLSQAVRLIDNNNQIIDIDHLVEYDHPDLLMHSLDDLYWNVSVSIRDIRNPDNTVLGKVIIIVDITEQKKRENEIVYLSYHDTLTDLYNRTYLEEEIKRLDTKRQLPFSIIMGDVNGLKLTNDVFGHDAGDQLLRKVGKSLSYVCRKEDIVGRWGGDEFVILLPQTTSEEAHIIMDRIISHFNHMSSNDMVKGIIPSISLGYGVKQFAQDDITDVMKAAETNMYKRKMLSKTSMHSKIIHSMQTALHEKSDETEAHCNRLFNYCEKMAHVYGLSNEALDDLEIFCKLHDLGKIGVNDDVLQKPGPLTKGEWAIMKRHPEIGYRIAHATPELQNVSKYILSHHEKFDGSGYPKGLKGHDIPLLSRILSVADAYDAMTTKRPYNHVKSKTDALNEILSNAGTQFDPEVVRIFIDLMESGAYDE
jgi:diguanylate cyclase (GGDEF)-like protein